MAVLLSLLTFFSTLTGGFFGLRHQDKLHLILGFTAGVILGVVAFDIFPEIISITNRLQTEAVFPMIALVAGFLIFHVLEKVLVIHHDQSKHPTIGLASALALAGHSFLDGVGIGLGFQVSPAAGVLIALAVIAHDFSDGLNTVSLMLVHKNSHLRARNLLFLDAAAPVLGALSTRLFSVPENILLLYLGFFAGFLLYIGASDILPEAHSEHSSYRTLFLTIFGAVLIFLVTRFD
ncbi:MAG: ZIP family metal transporter [Patescibacteria group bacterium]|nr:ZIP family metal transporter [Patescibacteria group bacterium]